VGAVLLDDLVGRYALAFKFSDGHDTGIYSFDMLYKLGHGTPPPETVSPPADESVSGCCGWSGAARIVNALLGSTRRLNVLGLLVLLASAAARARRCPATRLGLDPRRAAGCLAAPAPAVGGRHGDRLLLLVL
jgi:hypothetical protein